MASNRPLCLTEEIDGHPERSDQIAFGSVRMLLEVFELTFFLTPRVNGAAQAGVQRSNLYPLYPERLLPPVKLVNALARLVEHVSQQFL